MEWITLAAVLIPALGVLLDLRSSRIFTLRSFVSILFLLEYGGQALKLHFSSYFPSDLYASGTFTLPYAPKAILLGLAAYIIFLVAYSGFAAVFVRRPPPVQAAAARFFDRHWHWATRLCLAVVTSIAIAAGFVQIYQRIRAAGGLTQFLLTAYQYRVGTVTEGASQNAVVGLANVVAGTALGFIVLWALAWAAGKLTWVDKLFVLSAGALLIARQGATMSRGTLIFTVVGLVGAWLTQRRVPFRRIVAAGILILVLLLGINWVHQYLYYLTGGWDRKGFVESTGMLLGAQGHVFTLGHVLYTVEYGGQSLRGQGLIESVLFFVPRLIWHDKAPGDAYGTYLVQRWAALPMSYQMAITAPGEFYAHFGYAGLIGMVIYGALYAYFDTWRLRGPILRSAFFGMLLSRVLVDIGMGISALSITLFVCATFIVLSVLAVLCGDILEGETAGVRSRFARLRRNTPVPDAP